MKQLVCAALLAVGVSGIAGAQGYPTRPVRVIVPLVPGGGTDNPTRIMAPKVSELLGQQVVVENRAGAAGRIGTEPFARAAPDGYALLNVDTSFAGNPSLFSKLPYAMRGYWGSLAPAATPREVVNTLNGAMRRVLQMPEIRQRLIGLGYDPIGSTPDQFAANLRSEMAKWEKAVKDAKIRVE